LGFNNVDNNQETKQKRPELWGQREEEELQPKRRMPK